MDKIFHPNERAWISDPFQLEKAFEKLNKLVDDFVPIKNYGSANNEPQLLQIMQDPSKDSQSVSEQLSKLLGGDDFFKVKIRDDEMYTKYNYGTAEESNIAIQDVSFGKELISSFNEVEYGEEDTMSEWSLDEMDDDEMDPRWRNFGAEKLKAVVERHTLQTEANDEDVDPNICSSDDNESDVNVISDESEDEELTGGGAPKKGTDAETGASTSASASTSKMQSPLKSEPEEPAPKVDDEEEFKDFNEWAFKITKQKAAKLEVHQMKKLNTLTGAAKAKYEMMLRSIDPQLASVPGETFQDDPIKSHSSMPVLASPIAKKAKSTLQTLAIYISHQDDPTGFHWKSSTVQQQINEDIRTASLHNRQTSSSQMFKTEDVEPSMYVDMKKDFVVTVSFFHPKDTDNAAVDGIHKYLEPKLALELTLLNTNTLSDLREAFRCENDLAVLEEVEHPRDYDESEFRKKSVKTLFPSGMILVNDTIYADSSSGKFTDYCALINKWAASQPPKEIGPFQRGELSTTQIKDLNLRFGYPYVYIHQGSCEHIVVFNAARKLHSQDHNLRSAYPYVEGQMIFKTINCRVDNEYIARWAVLDCKRFPENPMLICTQCLENYCYDKDGNKVDNFSLFPFKQVANTT